MLEGLVRVVAVVEAAVGLVAVEVGRADAVLLVPASGLRTVEVVPVTDDVGRGLLGELVEEGAMVEVRRDAVVEATDLLDSSSEADTLGRDR